MIRGLSVTNAYKDDNTGEIIKVYDVLKYSRIYRTVPVNDIVTLFNGDANEKRPQINKEVLNKLEKIRREHGRR